MLVLQNFVKTNKQEMLQDVFDHAESELTSCQWIITGWCKSKATDDAVLMVPRAHIVSVLPTGTRQPKQFISTVEPMCSTMDDITMVEPLQHTNQHRNSNH